MKTEENREKIENRSQEKPSALHQDLPNVSHLVALDIIVLA